MPEDQHGNTDQYQYQFINQRYCHQYNRRLRQTVLVLAHVIELHRLPARSRGRDAGIKETDKRIKNTPNHTASSVQRTEQIVNHDTLGTDKKQRCEKRNA